MECSQVSVLFQLQSKFNPDLFSAEREPLEALEWAVFMENNLQAFKEVSEPEKIVYLTGNLEGSARTASIGAPRTTAEAFLKWFRELYCSNLTHFSILTQLEELKQTNSLREYMVEFKRLLAFNNYVPPSTPSAILARQFMKGLQNPALSRALEHVRFSTEEETNGTMLKEIMRIAETWVSRGLYSEFSHNPALNPNISRDRRGREKATSSFNQENWKIVSASEKRSENSSSRQQNYSGSSAHRRGSVDSYEHDSKHDSSDQSAKPASGSDEIHLGVLMLENEQPLKPTIGWKELAPASRVSECRQAKEKGRRC